jgi:hypothetical protein
VQPVAHVERPIEAHGTEGVGGQARATPDDVLVRAGGRGFAHLCRLVLDEGVQPVRFRGAVDDGGGHLVLDDVEDDHDQVRCLSDDGLAGLEVDLDTVAPREALPAETPGRRADSRRG